MYGARSGPCHPSCSQCHARWGSEEIVCLALPELHHPRSDPIELHAAGTNTTKALSICATQWAIGKATVHDQMPNMAYADHAHTTDLFTSTPQEHDAACFSGYKSNAALNRLMQENIPCGPCRSSQLCGVGYQQCWERQHMGHHLQQSQPVETATPTADADPAMKLECWNMYSA